MLVLERKIDQKIFIRCPNGALITVYLNRVGSRTATLGVNAPSDYKIYRDELADGDGNLLEETRANS